MSIRFDQATWEEGCVGGDYLEEWEEGGLGEGVIRCPRLPSLQQIGRRHQLGVDEDVLSSGHALSVGLEHEATEEVILSTEEDNWDRQTGGGSHPLLRGRQLGPTDRRRKSSSPQRKTTGTDRQAEEVILSSEEDNWGRQDRWRKSSSPQRKTTGTDRQAEEVILSSEEDNWDRQTGGGSHPLLRGRQLGQTDRRRKSSSPQRKTTGTDRQVEEVILSTEEDNRDRQTGGRSRPLLRGRPHDAHHT